MSQTVLRRLTRSHSDGGPDLVQMLTPEGERVDREEFEHDPLLLEALAVADTLDAERLRGFYRDMYLVRRFDSEATALQRHGELGLWAPLLGQEAAQIGAGRAMLAQDYAFPSYREHGVAWCRGLDPVDLFGLFRGTTMGAWNPADTNFHLYTIVIGNQVLHATGYAMGVIKDGAHATGDRERDTAVITFFGDGGSSQGDVSESLVFAGVFNAPLVFFCQNNQWAISEPNERQMRIPLYQRARGFGFPGLRVDGNDVIACYAVASVLLDRARTGEGPALIEAFTYRMGAHTTTDDPTRYRIEAEVEAWKLKDPIARLQVYLSRTGGADREFFDAVAAEADDLGADVRRRCRELADPDPQTMFDHVYQEPHSGLEAERTAFIEYESSFEDDRADGDD